MTLIILDANRTKRRHYELDRQEGSYCRGKSGMGLATDRLFIAEGAPAEPAHEVLMPLASAGTPGAKLQYLPD